MLKKVLMITLYLALGYQAKASFELPHVFRSLASERSEASNTQNICMIHAGDIGKLKYKGRTYEEAFSRVTDECFQRRTQQFVKARNVYPDQDRQIQFAESCVNSIKCI
jgi:hypothetical protein